MAALFFDIDANFAKGQLPAIYTAGSTSVVLDSVIAGVGTVTTNGTTTLTGVGTVFTNTFQAGDTITVEGESIRTISAVSSDTVLLVTSAFVTTTSTLAYVVGGGARFPDPAVPSNGPYNVVWWDQKTYPDPDDDPNKEIVRVTAKVGDTLTISRAQENTLATDKNSFGGLYAVSNVLTKFVMDQIRAALGHGSAHVIEDNGSVMPQEPALNFVNFFTLSDVPGVSTNVDINVFELANDTTFINDLIANTYFTSSLANDPTFITDLTNNATFQTDISNNISGLVAVAVDGVTITGDGTLGNPLVATGTGSGHIIQDHGVARPQEPALNFADYFIVTDNPSVSSDVTIDVVGLANDTTFITTLTNNVAFQTAVSIFVSGSGTLQIDQTPLGTGSIYGLLAGTVDGINTTFTVSAGKYGTGKLQVYLNGLIQLQGVGDDWTETTPASGTFDFVVPPLTGDIITVVYSGTTVASGTSLAITVNQVAHGLSVGDVIKSNGTDNQFSVAQGDNGVNSEALGIVTVVVDADNFTYVSSAIQLGGGFVPVGTPGDAIWLDPAVPGGMTTTKPSVVGQIARGLGTIIASGAVMYFDISALAEEITSSSGGAGSDTALFTYGDTITANDYVFQSDGGESVLINHFTGGASYTVDSTSKLSGGLFTASSIATSLTAYRFSISNLNGSGHAGNIVCKLFVTSSNLPTGSSLATSTTTGFSYGTHNVTFSSPALVPGTQYAIVIDTSGLSGLGIGSGIGIAGDTGTNFFSTNNGVSWSSGSGTTQQIIFQGLDVDKVYKVDETGAILNMGPYKGFAVQSGVLNDVKAVQIGGVAPGFVLTDATEVYIDQTTPGGVTQTPGGRNIGIAISTSDIQMNLMKKVGDRVNASNPIPSDGILVAVSINGGTPSATTWTISKDNFMLDTTGITYSLGSIASGSGNSIGIVSSVPVKQGNGYTVAGTGANVYFYPTLMG